jgi:hypothetical protein
MRGFLAPIRYPNAVPALAGFMSRTAPFAIGSEGSRDSIAYGTLGPVDERWS